MSTGSLGLDLENGTRYATLAALHEAVRAGRHTDVRISSLEALGLDLSRIVELVEELRTSRVSFTAEGCELTSDEGLRLLAACARVEAAGRSRRSQPNPLVTKTRGRRSAPPEGSGRPSMALATESGVSTATIRRDAGLAEDVRKLAAVDPDIEKKVAGGRGPTRTAIAAAAAAETPEEAAAILSGKAPPGDQKK